MKKIIIFAFILFLTGCGMFETNLKETKNDKPLSLPSSLAGTASIHSYTIYGRFFNISGELEEEVSQLILVLKTEQVEREYNLNLKTENGKTIFTTSSLINQGINLEDVLEGEYVLLLKKEENEIEYYTLKNATSYKDLEYYTITKENVNRKIKIGFDDFNGESFFFLESKKANLEDNIYDIVIDAGHGGVDVGANKNGYYESHINLDYALALKKELTALGLKVKLTRETDKSISNYGEEGRVSIPYKTKAKLMLSIHMNSALKNVGKGGVEVYVPNHADIGFASSLAKNIVSLTSSSYSANVSNKVASGVYLRTLSKSDVEGIKEEAKEKGYAPYEKATTDSTYYYIIRETGGIVTNAYVDSRNKEKEWNRYYASNHGCESYLVELGYMNSSSNLKILLNEKEEYVKAIVKSVKEYLEI